MPDTETEFGLKMLLPDLLTIEAQVKSYGYPKLIQLVLLYLLFNSFKTIKSRREYEKAEKERGDGAEGSDGGAEMKQSD